MKHIKHVLLLLLLLVGGWCWLTFSPARTTDVMDMADITETEEVGQIEKSLPARHKPISKRLVISTEAEVQKDFYQTIIDNNIFRPLGYRERTPAPQFKLIGITVSEQKTETTAVILERKTQRVSTVNVGDKIGDVLVKEIAAKQVILQDGDNIITLHSPPPMFLNVR